jgi:long-chain acyl-CoA synthetase
MQLITDALHDHAATGPDRTFLISGSLSLSYGQTRAYALRVVAWLTDQGIKAGDRVIMAADSDDPWFAVTYLGTLLADAVAVPLSAKVPETVRSAIHEQVFPALVLGGDTLESLKRYLMSDASAPACDIPRVRPDDVAEILFTSGTTGQPKGVVLRHSNILAAATNIVAFVGNCATDREVLTVPLSHSFGLGRLRSNLLVGGTIILVPGLSFPALAFRALEAHAATGLACVPAGAAVLMKWDATRLERCAPNLRYMELGSSPMALTLKQRLMSLLPTTRICMHYGLTEASRSAFIEFHADSEKLASIGKPAPNVEIAISDERGAPLPAGEVGRIRIRAATVLKEYWRNPELTRRVLDEADWFDTGDLGHTDSDGYLYFDGRRDDLINVGGKKVYPVAVEEAAAAHPGVREAACVSEPDPREVLGDVPVLFVVPREGTDVLRQELMGFIANRVEAHAVPARVEFVTELPKTSAGKVQRRLLRERLMRSPVNAI